MNLLKTTNSFKYYQLILLFFLGSVSYGQSFVNGSCEGISGLVMAPTDWTMVSGSTDLLTVPSPVAGLTFSAAGASVSSDGGMFVESYADGWGYTERFEQTVAGFTIGETYTLTFEEANFGTCLSGFCPTSAGQWLVYVSGLPVMTSGNILDISGDWITACITFEATATSHTFGFEADLIPGAGSDGTAILIDNIQLVPGGAIGTPADLEYDNVVLCTGAPVEAPVVPADPAGVFSATPAGLSISVTEGYIYPAASVVGIYDLTYTPSGCFEPVTITIEIVDGPSAVFAYSPIEFCMGDVDPLPNFDIDGDGVADGLTGEFTAAVGLVIDPITGEIDLSASLPGDYVITNTLADMGCGGDVATFAITILAPPTANFEYPDITFCAGGMDPMPEFDVDGDGIPDGIGGVFSALPVGLVIDPLTGEIDLSASAVGMYTVSNTIIDIGCGGDVFTFDLTILDVSSAAFVYSATTYCQDDVNPLPLFDTDFDGIEDGTAGVFSSAAGLVINPVTGEINLAASTEGTYTVTNTIASIECGDDVETFDVTIEALPIMDAIADQVLCHGEAFIIPEFTSSGVAITYNWINITGTDLGFGVMGTGDISGFTGSNMTGAPVVVTVEVYGVSLFGCEGPPIVFDVTVMPTPNVSFTADPYEVCSPTFVTFNNTTIPSGLNCTWDFGDGTTGAGCATVGHSFLAGNFDISLTVESAEGCVGMVTYADYIQVIPTPEANFLVNQHITDIYNPDFTFYNQSTDAVSYNWDFDDGSAFSTDENPEHTYISEPGTYNVVLWAYQTNPVCYDSTIVQVVVDDIILYFVPNAFTPDGDEFNETFKPVFTSGIDPYDFHLVIYNRWGEIMFETYDATVGWDGVYGAEGVVEDGVYIWQIDFKETMSDKRHTELGHFTVIR